MLHPHEQVAIGNKAFAHICFPFFIHIAAFNQSRACFLKITKFDQDINIST